MDKSIASTFFVMAPIEIQSNTRYLFIRPVNISYEIDGNTGQFNFKRVRSSTTINGSITVKNIKFNLHGAIIYSGSGVC